MTTTTKPITWQHLASLPVARSRKRAKSVLVETVRNVLPCKSKALWSQKKRPTCLVGPVEARAALGVDQATMACILSQYAGREFSWGSVAAWEHWDRHGQRDAKRAPGPHAVAAYGALILDAVKILSRGRARVCRSWHSSKGWRFQVIANKGA